MRKSLFFAGLAAATLAFVGCNKEADVRGLDGVPVEIVLSNVDTRTVNDGMATKWVDGDALNVFYAPTGTSTWSKNTKFTVKDADSNLATGTVEDLSESAYDWYLLYPYSSYVVSPTGLNAEGNPSGYLTVGSASNAAQQQTVYNSMAHLAGSNLPVYGVVKNVPAAEHPVVSMSHIASVIKVNVKNQTSDPVHVTNISVTAPVDIVGTYYLDISGSAPAFTPSGDTYVSKTASLVVKDPADLAVGATAEFYLAVKPFSVDAGSDLSVSITGSNGEQVVTKTLDKAAVFQAGFIKELNVVYDKAHVVSEYEWVKKNLDSVTEEDTFVIVGNNGVDYAMSNDKGTSAAPAAVSVAVENEKLVNEPAESIQWKMTKSGSGYKFAPVGAETVLYATNTNNGLRVGTGENDVFTLEQGYLKNVGTSRYVGIYNSADWRCYTSINSNITGQTFAFYVKYKTGTVTPDKVFTAELAGAADGQNLEVAASETSATIVIKADEDIAWTAEPSEGLVLSATSGTGSANVTATFPANTTSSAKNYSVLVRTTAAGVENEEFELSITQLGKSIDAKPFPFEETFGTSQGDFTIENVNKPDDLNYVWSYDSSYKYMKASAYKSSTNYATESWLISPAVDLSSAESPVLTFSHATNYFASIEKAKEEATVWVREKDATAWTPLTGVNYPTALGWTFVDSGAIDLSSYVGKQIQIGFKYLSTAEKAGTWEVKNFKLAERTTGPVDPTLTVPQTLSVDEGKTATISVSTNSDGAKTWTTSNAAVATVDNGVVTGVKEGTATITLSLAATESFNAASATVTVTVNKVDGSLHEIVIADFASTSFVAGAYSVSASKADGTTAPSYNATNKDLRVYAKGTVTVSNSKENITKIVFNISAAGLKRLAPITASNGTIATQAAGDTKVTWTGNASEVVFTVGDKAEFGTEGADKAGQLDFTSISVAPWSDGDVQPKTLSSIEVSGQKTSFTVGDPFSFGGTVTAVYSDGSHAVVTEEATFSGYDMNTKGEQTVVVTYQTVTTSYTITVNEKVVSSGDVLTAADFTATTSAYADFSGVSKNSGAVYAGNSANNNGNIQLRSSGSNSGIVSTTSGGKVKSITIKVASGNKAIDVYGNSNAYTAATDLYSTSGNTNQGTKIGSLTETGTINVEGDYQYIGIRSNNGAVYISEISIVWE